MSVSSALFQLPDKVAARCAIFFFSRSCSISPYPFGPNGNRSEPVKKWTSSRQMATRSRHRYTLAPCLSQIRHSPEPRSARRVSIPEI